MTRVLLVLENNPNSLGGIERHCRNLMDMFLNDKSITISSISKEDIPYRKLKTINKIIFDYKALNEAIVKSNCDVIHIHGFASLVIPQVIKIAHQLNKKIIYTAHYHPFYTLNNPLAGRLFFNLFVRSKLKGINRIVTINNEDTDFFKKYNSNVIQVPHWLSELPSITVEKQPDSILFVGRNSISKGIDYLNEIPKGKYQIDCVTDSAGGLRPDITIHKGIDDLTLSSLYARSSLLVVPSRYEAFSYVVLEALERGTPVLISDKVRIADYLLGISGITIFKFGDKKHFIAQIDQAMNQKVDVEKVKSIFSPMRIKKIYSEIYE